jgi:hypothetical protein
VDDAGVPAGGNRRAARQAGRECAQTGTLGASRIAEVRERTASTASIESLLGSVLIKRAAGRRQRGEGQIMTSSLDC